MSDCQELFLDYLQRNQRDTKKQAIDTATTSISPSRIMSEEIGSMKGLRRFVSFGTINSLNSRIQ
jgi:hypothetical protein